MAVRRPVTFARLRRLIEDRTGWSIRKFVRTARRYRTVQIRARRHSLAAEAHSRPTSAKPSPLSSSQTWTSRPDSLRSSGTSRGGLRRPHQSRRSSRARSVAVSRRASAPCSSNGRPTTRMATTQSATFMDYLLPTDLRHSAKIEIEHLETVPLDADVNFRGVGEGGMIVAPPTVVSAIEDALRAVRRADLRAVTCTFRRHRDDRRTGWSARASVSGAAEPRTLSDANA